MNLHMLKLTGYDTQQGVPFVGLAQSMLCQKINFNKIDEKFGVGLFTMYVYKVLINL